MSLNTLSYLLSFAFAFISCIAAIVSICMAIGQPCLNIRLTKLIRYSYGGGSRQRELLEVRIENIGNKEADNIEISIQLCLPIRFTFETVYSELNFVDTNSKVVPVLSDKFEDAAIYPLSPGDTLSFHYKTASFSYKDKNKILDTGEIIQTKDEDAYMHIKLKYYCRLLFIKKEHILQNYYTVATQQNGEFAFAALGKKQIIKLNQRLSEKYQDIKNHKLPLIQL